MLTGEHFYSQCTLYEATRMTPMMQKRMNKLTTLTNKNKSPAREAKYQLVLGKLKDDLKKQGLKAADIKNWIKDNVPTWDQPAATKKAKKATATAKAPKTKAVKSTTKRLDPSAHVIWIFRAKGEDEWVGPKGADGKLTTVKDLKQALQIKDKWDAKRVKMLGKKTLRQYREDKLKIMKVSYAMRSFEVEQEGYAEGEAPSDKWETWDPKKKDGEYFKGIKRPLWIRRMKFGSTGFRFGYNPDEKAVYLATEGGVMAVRKAPDQKNLDKWVNTFGKKLDRRHDSGYSLKFLPVIDDTPGWKRYGDFAKKEVVPTGDIDVPKNFKGDIGSVSAYIPPSFDYSSALYVCIEGNKIRVIVKNRSPHGGMDGPRTHSSSRVSFERMTSENPKVSEIMSLIRSAISSDDTIPRYGKPTKEFEWNFTRLGGPRIKGLGKAKKFLKALSITK